MEWSVKILNVTRRWRGGESNEMSWWRAKRKRRESKEKKVNWCNEVDHSCGCILWRCWRVVLLLRLLTKEVSSLKVINLPIHFWWNLSSGSLLLTNWLSLLNCDWECLIGGQLWRLRCYDQLVDPKQVLTNPYVLQEPFTSKRSVLGSTVALQSR